MLRGVNLNKDRIGDVPEEYAEVTFDIGCPAPRVFELALREGRVLDYRERTELVQENIAPSYADLNPYRFFLYLVEPAAYAAAFGDEPYAVSSEEFVCEGICMSVTEAVYVPTGAPSAHVEAGFLEVLSLLTGEQIRQQRADLAAAETPIDTSAWRSYASPLGFELQYPPDWTLDIVSDDQMRVLDAAYKQALDAAIAAGQGDVGLPPIPGASQFSVIANISLGFDVDKLIGSCGNDALRTTLLGRAAIRCPGNGTLTDTLSSVGTSYWVEFPPGHTMLIGGSVISEGRTDLAIIDAILESFAFTPSP